MNLFLLMSTVVRSFRFEYDDGIVPVSKLDAKLNDFYDVSLPYEYGAVPCNLFE